MLILSWAVVSSPVALVPLGLAAVFLDAKRRREGAWLTEQHPDYTQYRVHVRRRSIPWVCQAVHSPIPAPKEVCPSSKTAPRRRGRGSPRR